VRAHLAALGIELSPLSDLDRDDFASDETPLAMLDALLQEVAR
jgi:hypothetical protein